MRKKILSKREFVPIVSISEYCMVSPSTVRRWIRDGKLQAMELPSGQFRVSFSDFIAFLKKYKMPIPKDLLEIGCFLFLPLIALCDII